MQNLFVRSDLPAGNPQLLHIQEKCRTYCDSGEAAVPSKDRLKSVLPEAGGHQGAELVDGRDLVLAGGGDEKPVPWPAARVMTPIMLLPFTSSTPVEIVMSQSKSAAFLTISAAGLA